MNDELLKVLEQERWPQTSCRYDVDGHNEAIDRIAEAIDRIAEAAKKPRVMKRWVDECKPEKNKVAWLKIDYNRDVDVYFISKSMQETGVFLGGKITHWLELEQTPILPEDKK